ncbi:cytochrome P450 [Trametes elegans]|nr:cytochrome P450 [Trametes elegans]
MSAFHSLSRFGSRRMVVITTYEAATDIMVKQAHNLAGRPRMVAAGELMSNGMHIVVVGAGECLRRFRNALHAMLQPQAATKCQPLQMQHAQRFILDLLDKHEDFFNHAKTYAASVIMTVTYGKTTTTTYSDQEVQQINLVIARVGHAVVPGAYYVDAYPFLKYLPWFTSELKRFDKEEPALYRSQVQGVKDRLAKNEVQPFFTTSLLERQEEFQRSDDELAHLARAMFGAGSDTVRTRILPVMIMAAATHPKLQAKVQAQLDAVVGRDRLPTFAHQAQLPEVYAYTQALHKWRPMTPMGFMHTSTKDITWKNYMIPAGTEVLASHWAISRHPTIYPDPDAFKPEHWLTKEGTIRSGLKFYNWGFGRRYARPVLARARSPATSVYVNTALTLWAFEISEDPAHPIDTMAIEDGGGLAPRSANLGEKLRAQAEVRGFQLSTQRC